MLPFLTETSVIFGNVKVFYNLSGEKSDQHLCSGVAVPENLKKSFAKKTREIK